ncbi:SUKH-4 family immunity protein [Actinacidiphila sp. bgisy167]|uniref:SUKH-4 family immunity protein n=1 Tax=Actinacidiphila sp. bgisy167 TaxID=3413797 RepID=UPI003D713E5F
MVTFAQAQERAEEWINAGVPGHLAREVRVREFDRGFVVWSEPREDGPTADDGEVRIVIARDSGEATLWPALPVGEIVRRWEEAYGTAADAIADAVPEPPRRIDLEATSFLLSPPQWLQDAADRLGIPGSRGGADAAFGGTAATPVTTPPPAPAPAPVTAPGPATPTQPYVPTPTPTPAPIPYSGAPTPPPAVWRDANDSGGAGASVPPPATVYAPPISDSDDAHTPSATANADAGTERLPGVSGTGTPLPQPRTQGGHGHPGAGTAVPPPPPPPAPFGGPPPPPPAPSAPARPGAGDAHHAAAMPSRPDAAPPPPRPAPGPNAGAADLAAAETVKAAPPGPPPPPPGPGVPGTPAAGYVPTQLVQALPANDPPGPPAPPKPAAGDVHHAATVLSRPDAGGRTAPPPPPPGPVAPGPAAAQPPAYGYPHPPQPLPPTGVPTVGPGYLAVLRYRAPDGSEQQLIRRSAPGTPHPEWQILHELRALGVPPQAVLELHTELESCDLPGGYCARMIRETWPQVRISSTAPYGTDHASRRAGVQHLLTHLGELHQVASAPAHAHPQRVPMPEPHRIQRVPPVPLDAIGHELAQSFGPQGVFRFDQRAVARQGVPDLVAQTLTWCGLPVDFGPFFWAQAQPGRPVPTLAELAVERGAQPAPDAGSYLVMGNDFGRQLCVQYGTAHIVAVPLEAGPGGTAAVPQFVNTGLPEFVRCLALLGTMWRWRLGLTPEQAGRWTVDFQNQLAALDPAAVASPEHWWPVLVEQMWDGML